MPNKPFIIELEGSDGSGKETQAKLLAETLNNLGYPTKIISFPQYDNISSTFVKKYLAGDYGANANDINPYVAASFFTIDRTSSYHSDWKDIVNDRHLKFVIMDRYVGSNILHQATKLSGYELVEFVRWLEDAEYTKFGLPKADIVYYLDMPRWASKLLTKNRANKITGDSKKDIHESNESYMSKVYKSSNKICKFLHWEKISCISAECGTAIGDLGDILTPEDICDNIIKDIIERFISI